MEVVRHIAIPLPQPYHKLELLCVSRWWISIL